MLDAQDTRTITANVDEVLDALYKNLAQHQELVAEAQKGYHDKIRETFTTAQKTTPGSSRPSSRCSNSTGTP
jgi:hypothetical protein